MNTLFNSLKGYSTPHFFFLSLITYPHVVPNPLKLHSSSEHNLRYFGWKPGGLWLSHWLPSKYHCQGPEKSERHCQKRCYVKIIQQFVSSASPLRHFGEYPLDANSLCCSVSVVPHGYAVFYLCGAADKEQHTLFVFSGYSPKWRKGDADEANCWIKSLFLFSLRTKSILIAS